MKPFGVEALEQELATLHSEREEHQKLHAELLRRLHP